MHVLMGNIRRASGVFQKVLLFMMKRMYFRVD